MIALTRSVSIMVTIQRPSNGKGSLSYARRYQRGKYAPDNSIKAPANQFSNSLGAERVNVISVDPSNGFNPSLRSSAIAEGFRLSMPRQNTTQKVIASQSSTNVQPSQFRNAQGATLTSKSYYNKKGEYVTEDYGSYKEQVVRDRAVKQFVKQKALDYYKAQDSKSYIADVRQKQLASSIVRGRARVPVNPLGYSMYQDMLSAPVVSQPALYRIEERTKTPVRSISQVSMGITSYPSPYAIRRTEAVKKGTLAEILPSSEGFTERYIEKLRSVRNKSIEYEKKGFPKSFFLTGAEGYGGFRASEISAFGIGLGSDFYEGIRQQPRKAALYFAIGGALPSIVSGAKYGAYRAGLGRAVPYVGNAISIGLTGYYGYTKYKEYKARKTGDTIEDYATVGKIMGRSLSTEILPSYAGARTIGIRLARPLTGRVMIEETIQKYKLPPTEAKAFRSLMTTTFKGQPPVKPIDFGSVQALKGKGKASDITMRYLLKNKGFFRQNLVIGGSVAQKSQIHGMRSRSPRDIDIFLRFPKTAAKGLARELRSGGVRDVSYSYGNLGTMRTGKVFVEGKKAVEFHKLAWFKEFPFYQGMVRSPEGFKVMKIGEQTSRKAFGAFIAERSKDLPDFEKLSKLMFRDELIKARKSWLAPRYKEKVVREEMSQFYKNLGIVKTYLGKKGSFSLGFSNIKQGLSRPLPETKTPKIRNVKVSKLEYSSYKPFRGSAYSPYNIGKYMVYDSFAYVPLRGKSAYERYVDYKPYNVSKYDKSAYGYQKYQYQSLSKPYAPYKGYDYKPSSYYSSSKYQGNYGSKYQGSYSPYYSTNYYRIPKEPPSILKDSFNFEFQSVRKEKKYLQSQRKKYTPSLIALDFRIKGKAPKRISGFEIRPLLKRK